jgi:hypothetical protein
VGKSTKPGALKNFDRNLLPVKYYAQKSAGMNQEIFTTWFHDVFVVEVKSYLKSKNLPAKALLIMDNALAHPLNELADEGIKCVFLPANTSSLIQPMDQGVIENLKRHYRKIFLQNYIFSNLEAFWKQYTIKHAIFYVADAWNNVSNQALSRSWNKIWQSGAVNEEKQELEEISRICNDVFQMEQSNVNDWLNVDSSDLGYEMFNDKEIVERVTKKEIIKQEADDDDDEEDIFDVFQIEQGCGNDRLNVNNSDLGYEILNDNEIVERVTKRDIFKQEADDDDEDDILNSQTIRCKEVEEMLMFSLGKISA